ncbi:WxL domain-containing protein [Enterococcus faecalis]|uniref:WxL domain-containing protein n=1 Tax=Enterococcus faecalis TaxID=1351 RepID=UPI003CC60DBD
MKQTKWQRLATIGLCSSLVINAFSGVTAVAETVTIESSPTAESSAKEETPASSVKEETTKASTENSQVTTDTSQEEATKEAEKQAETEVKEEQKEEPQAEVEQAETATSEVVQPNPLLAPTPVSGLGVRAGNLATLSPQLLALSNKLNAKTVSVPSAQLGIVFESEDNASLNMADFSLKTGMLYNRFGTNVEGTLTEAPLDLVTTNTLVAENTKTANGFDIILPSINLVSVGYTTEANVLVLEDPEITIPKYIDSLRLKNLGIQRSISATVNGAKVSDATLEMSLSKEGDKYVVKQPLGSIWNKSYTQGNYTTRFISTNRPTDGYKSSVNFYIAMQDINLIAVHKKVTEKFVNTSGVAITPPTGFTQNKKTPMTSNDFTFKQAGTLPDTYTTGGKTYKFKGWYKGKTKPSTLTTTKAPSYAVTYDGNDDLNVVYEEANFPAVTYQFGFVNEAGQLVNPADIKITYDHKSIAFRGTGGTGSTVSFGTLATNQSGSTVGKLKEVTLPAANIARPTATGWNGDAFSNFSIKLPRYYQSLNLYDKAGKINPNYPLPAMTMINSTGENTDQTEAAVIANLILTQRADKSYTPKELYSVADPSVKYPYFLRRVINSANLSSGNLTYWTVGSPIYYHLTNRKVTENFVNTSGAKITAPSGFTQGKQTAITSDPYTFKQAGTLPDTYTTGGKTYKFKGWYKGKTKPSTLTTTKAPSYGVTYDDNDDLNVVYEETKEKTATIPAVTYKFGFVDEKGALVAPTNFNMTTNLTTIMNGTPKQVGTASGVNNGNLKQLTIPSQQLIYTPTVNPAYSGTTDFRLTVPKQYKLPTVTPGTYYTGSSTTYPIATTRMRYVDKIKPDERLETDGSRYKLFTTTTANAYQMKTGYWEGDTSKIAFTSLLSQAIAKENPAYFTTDDTMYYFLENRRVTETFVDTSGAKITPPTGFTQGKKTAITSDAYTFKQAGTLPDTYTTGGKTYKFKGWYKGKSIPNTLTTTKAPSYQVTYDDNDDLNVVYEEETVTTFYPSLDVNFVNEKGGAFTPALTFSGKYYVRRTSDSVITNLYDVTSKSKGNGQYTVSINNGSVPLSQELFKKYTNGYTPTGPNALAFRLDKLAIDQQLKYVDSIQVETAQSSGLDQYRYEYTDSSSTIIDSSVAPIASNLPTAEINTLNFKTDGTNFSHTSFRFLGMTIGSSMSSTGKYLFHTNLFSNNPTNDAKLVYKVTRKQVTENFVDANGAKITAPTGFTQGNQVPMNSNTFKYTAAQALPATYTAGGKVYTFQGWYKGKTKPSTLNKTTTPTFNATFDGNDDMTAMYKEEIPTASVTLTRPKEVIDTNTNVIWTTTITNTSKAPLQNLTLKKGPNWSAGLTIPTFMEVTPEGETTKSIPVNSTLWTNGVSLPNAVPIGKKVSVAFTTRATGKPNTVLKAEVVVFGGIKDSTVDNFVRIRPNDQEVVTPTTEGFISVPTFDFGQVGVAGSKQQHSLKQAADYYGNGTRNPYLRIKKTQPNWSLTAQLSQPKSATDSLPTATRLLLGAAPVSSFTNYNQPTELKNTVGTTSAISLTANNTATSIIANKQFTGSNVYQLDFTFNNVKLEVPANQGVKGQQYKAAVTWNLVTGP